MAQAIPYHGGKLEVSTITSPCHPASMPQDTSMLLIDITCRALSGSGGQLGRTT